MIDGWTAFFYWIVRFVTRMAAAVTHCGARRLARPGAQLTLGPSLVLRYPSVTEAQAQCRRLGGLASWMMCSGLRLTRISLAVTSHWHAGGPSLTLHP